MQTVRLKPDMAAQVSRLAQEAQTTVEGFVEAALREYLVKFTREKLRAERQAFDRQKEVLLAQYRGEYVAVHQGQVIDHDPGLGVLHSRVFARLGSMPVLLKRVTDEPDREWVFRSPRFERSRT